jgi:hypothetical protein
VTVDLREAFGSSALSAAARLFKPLAISGPPESATAHVKPAAADVSAQLGFQSVRIGRIDALVSFAALPFLPAGARSVGAVDRARLALRWFQLPSDADKSRTNESMGTGNVPAVDPFFPLDHVARLAARHYLAESASQIVRLVASNKLLGDPARFWTEIEAAARELFASPPRITSATRFSRRVAAAFAAWAKTVLRHAARVTAEMEDRFEAAKRRRLDRLRSRRIADADADVRDAEKRDSVAAGGSSETGANRRAARADVVAAVLRAAGYLVEGPLQGAELRGIPGLVEGAAEGIFGAAAAAASAALALASDLADGLETYCGADEEEDEDPGLDASVSRDEREPGGMRRRPRRPPTRLRPPRPPPASRLEPWRPFAADEQTNETA